MRPIYGCVMIEAIGANVPQQRLKFRRLDDGAAAEGLQ